MNVLLGVLAAVIMPIHAAFLYRDVTIWTIVYTLDFLHAIFMCAVQFCQNAICHWYFK